MDADKFIDIAYKCGYSTKGNAKKYVSYEEVLDEKVSLRTIQTEDEIVIPDCLMAMIQYRMGEERYTKTMFLQVSINDLEETEEFYAKE